MKKETKAIWGWALYDWANSAFATTVMAGFFPLFFKQYWSHGTDVNVSTAQLGFANALGSLLVAVMAPVLGAVADQGSAKKKFLIGFAYLGVLATANLFLIKQGAWAWAIFFYVMGLIGFSGANVFYDALLPSVCREEDIDYISGLGFSIGYLGGGLLFLVNVVMTLKPHLFGLADAAAAVRLSFLSVALWWGGFTLFIIFWTPERKPPRTTASSSSGGPFKAGFGQLRDTFRQIRHLKTVFIFLLAYWFYIDGVDTIIRMGVDYGIALGFNSNDLILALLLVQFVGFPAALAFGKLGQKWDVRKSIYLAIVMYMFITLWGTFMSQRQDFYILAVMIGLVQGGIQALSRSYYTRFIPPRQAAQFYGFYNMIGKFSAILGPALIGIVGLSVKHMLLPPAPTAEQITRIGHIATRCSLASILLLFLAGIILFYFVDEEKGRVEAQYLSDSST